jgi:plasmid stabilization system protein ParE
VQRVHRVARLPRAAAIVPEYSLSDVREVFVYRYRVIHRILAERIDVLAIVHGAKLLPEQLDDVV